MHAPCEHDTVWTVKRVAGAGCVAVGLAALVVVSGPIASADFSGPDSDDSTNSISVNAQTDCYWTLLGAPSALLFQPLDELGDPDPSIEYEGTELDLVALPTDDGEGDFDLFHSGTLGDRTGTTACSTYEPEGMASGATVEVSIDDQAVTAAAASGGADSSMDFCLAPTGEGDCLEVGGSLRTSALTVDFDSGSCPEPFSSSDSVDHDLTSTVPEQLMSIAGADVDHRVGVGVGQRCQGMVTWTMPIPALMTPTYPGQDYTFTGPNFVTTLTVGS